MFVAVPMAMDNRIQEPQDLIVLPVIALAGTGMQRTIERLTTPNHNQEEQGTDHLKTTNGAVTWF